MDKLIQVRVKKDDGSNTAEVHSFDTPGAAITFLQEYIEAQKKEKSKPA